MSASSRSGTVVIVVLVIVMTVSLAAYNFTLTMESEHLAIRNAGDRLAAQQSAFSGAEILACLLEQPREERMALQQQLQDGFELWPSLAGEDVAIEAFVEFDLAVGENSLTPMDVVDESVKLNLQTLLEWDLILPGQARNSLLQLPDMDEATADRILDWIDSDNTERGQGYEVHARNSLPLFVEELPWDDSQDDDPVTASRPAWIDLLTVSSAERNESFEGRSRINVNEPNLLTLHQQLLDVVPLPLANYIIVMRQYGMSQEVGEAVEAASVTIDFGVPGASEINSLMSLIDSQVAIRSESGMQIVASPIDAKVGLAGMAMGQILDQLTTNSSLRLVGRVNLMTAPAEVIASVPGLDAALAQQIVAGRSGSQGISRHAFDILSNAGIDPVIVERVLPYFTVGGDVLRARIVGGADRGNAEFRSEVLIDASDGRGRWTVLVGDCLEDRPAFQPPSE